MRGGLNRERDRKCREKRVTESKARGKEREREERVKRESEERERGEEREREEREGEGEGEKERKLRGEGKAKILPPHLTIICSSPHLQQHVGGLFLLLHRMLRQTAYHEQQRPHHASLRAAPGQKHGGQETINTE